MTDTITLPHDFVSRSDETVLATVASTGPGRRPPIFVPRDQLYYWTREWQDGEAAALRDVDEGNFRTFPDGDAAAEWLLSDDEDES